MHEVHGRESTGHKYLGPASEVQESFTGLGHGKLFSRAQMEQKRHGVLTTR